MAQFKMAGIPASYTTQAEEVQRGQNAKIQHLLSQVNKGSIRNVNNKYVVFSKRDLLSNFILLDHAFLTTDQLWHCLTEWELNQKKML